MASRFVAGVYARIDSRRGVWKSPAGTEANLAGAVGLAARLSDADQDVLNPIGVNAIRFFPSSGNVVWGVRTLATLADPAYRYVSVRRLAIFSLKNGTPQRDTIQLLDGIAESDAEEAEVKKAARSVALLLTKRSRTK